MSEPLAIDVYWSFRSPWSYLATPRLLAWKQKYELAVNFKPVYPIAIRTPEFFSNVPPMWFPYFMRDLVRVAEFLELPLTWPNPDPVVNERGPDGRQSFPKEQPYIHRLTRLGVLAEERGSGIEFANHVSSLIWSGTADWHEGEHLANAAATAGLDLAALDAQAETEAERLTDVIEQNQVDHEAAGHWGVPTCAFNGEPFFGQDRLDVLLWRLQKEGLQER
ncbi:MAG: 2-hydroxychromene-2-carboxylate isomerase [Gammaproteobacteria bacterium]|nr:2-hydroxychromene-2-carboxylate isomerase [Gammaproteobacteria bacterium]MCZ6855965.1 2-hydroxychromene-2-carboxylate isomerase [Gammaproteobacteria bacterium]